MINLTQSVQKIALNALWIDEVCYKYHLYEQLLEKYIQMPKSKGQG